MGIRFIRVESDYLSHLRQYNKHVYLDPTHTRPFVGVLLIVDQYNYYAPLSSPKPKFDRISANALDIFKIRDGKLGVINLNNMIPVPVIAIIAYDIAVEPDEKYRLLLQAQIRELNRNSREILRKANTLHKLVTSRKAPENLLSRCGDFTVLERAATQYCRP